MPILDRLYIDMQSAKILERGAEYSWHLTVKTTWESPREINLCSSSVQCLLLYHFYVNKQTDMEVTLGSLYLNNEQLYDCHQEDKRKQMEQVFSQNELFVLNTHE